MGKIYKNGIEYGGGGSGSAGHTILDNDGTSMPAEDNLQFKGLDVTDNSTDGITEVESVGLNQDSMDDVLNASIGGNQVASNGLVYSTEEQVVGKWIDGKPIYQKTVNYSNSDFTADSKRYIASISAKIPNIDTLVHSFGKASFMMNNVVFNYDLGHTDVSGNGTLSVSSYVVNDNVIIYSSGSITAISAVVTFQYTKTTDTV